MREILLAAWATALVVGFSLVGLWCYAGWYRHEPHRKGSVDYELREVWIWTVSSDEGRPCYAQMPTRWR